MRVSLGTYEQIFPASVVRLSDEKVPENAHVDAPQRLARRRSYFQKLTFEPHLNNNCIVIFIK